MDELVRMEGIDKSFPGVHALSNCRFDLMAGEVHVIVGENGAGKSTLMKILSGVYQLDSGEIYISGKKVQINNTRDARALGIGIIHQEFNLMPHLTVAQNIFIGREKRKFGLVDDSYLNAEAKKLLESMNLNIDPTQKVDSLSVAGQQMVEIVKALSYNSNVLIMDEPTSALAENEIEELFRIIGDLCAKKVGIVYISHRMDELMRIGNRVTIMRDGKFIACRDVKEITLDQIISMMVGRELFVEASQLKPNPEAPEVLVVEHISSGRLVKDVSFRVKAGEIIGISGLMGAGRTEMARAIFGAEHLTNGTVHVNGKHVKIRSPVDAVHHGIGYLSEDRKKYGLALGLDVINNMAMASLKAYTNNIGFVRDMQLAKKGRHYIDALQIKTPSAYQKLRNLSGGNQQKVVIAKWLLRNCNILIFDEPTRGIDVGAKQEIYKLMEALASEGKAIIMISSDLPEILRMSQRIVVMCEGRTTGELQAEEATQEKIMELATRRVS